MSHCEISTVNMKDLLRNMKCMGRQECRYTLRKQNGGRCGDRRKYLTLEYQCKAAVTTTAPITEVPIVITRPLPDGIEDITKEVIEKLKYDMEIQLT